MRAKPSITRFLRREHTSKHVERAIASIRPAIDEPLSVSALAERAGMSKSLFHAPFKAVTGLAPGKHQEDIRLLEAHCLILEWKGAISALAFDVGYESPTYFRRDYARIIGRSPCEDQSPRR